MDVHQILYDLLCVGLLVAVGIAKYYGGKLLAHFQMGADQSFLDKVIDEGAQAGINEVQASIGDKPITVDLHNQVLASAVSYVARQAEDEKTKLGYSDDDIAKAVLARLDLSSGTVAIAGAAPTRPPGKSP